MVPELIVTLIIGLFGGGGLGTYFNVRANNRKSDADTASTLVGAAGELIEFYKAQFEGLEEEIAELKLHVTRVEKERDKLQDRVDHLEEKVRRLEGR